MYVIAGVSGRTGAVVADTLLSQGKQVRVIVRNAEKGAAWQKKGAEVAVAELGDVAAMTKARPQPKRIKRPRRPDDRQRDLF